MSSAAQPNFYLWGAWKTKTIKEPFLTKKVAGQLKKVVLGDTFIIALKEKGQLISWGNDKTNGCLGLGPGKPQADAPCSIEGLQKVIDVQMGLNHVVALTENGEVYTWGNNEKGQLGLKTNGKPEWKPQKVDAINSEKIHQIVVVKHSTFALTLSGAVYAWGDNKDNVLGLDTGDGAVGKDCVSEPKRLVILDQQKVRKMEVFEGRTIIAHVHSTEPDDALGEELKYEDGKDDDDSEVNIFKGIDEMRKAMEKTQEWWNHLLNIKHGQPYDLPYDSDSKRKDEATLKEDKEVDPEKLHRAERHLDALISSAVAELRRTQNMPGTRNVKFILCMFIDECRLRREKVHRTIAARRLSDAKKKTAEISAYSVTDFGANANEEIRKIIAVTKELQNMLDTVKHIEVVDVMTEELKLTLIECLECKLQLHDTRVELLKAAEAKPSDPMLPALRILKDRWNSLKHFSLYALYLECETKRLDFDGDDDKHLEYLVKASNRQIDQMLQIDKDRIISHDTLVPALCYDLLRENAELRKMVNSYQLHVLLLHSGKQLSGPGVGKPGDATKAIAG